MSRDLDGAAGSRVPHLWLSRDGRRISTLDLIGSRFTVLTGPAGEEWIRAADEVAGALDVDLRAHRIAPELSLSDPDGRWPQIAGLTDDGVLLVRPDGFVCWRGPTATDHPVAALTAALTRVLTAADPHPHNQPSRHGRPE